MMSQTEPPATANPPAATTPRKRSRLWLLIPLGIAVPVIATLVAFYWPADAPTPPSSITTSSSTSYAVLYEAEGTGARGPRSVRYTIQTDSGGTSQGETNLPMKNRDGGTGLTFTNFQAGDFVYLSVQNRDAAGSVTCRITVTSSSGSVSVSKVVSENTSTGGSVIASCKGQVPVS